MTTPEVVPDPHLDEIVQHRIEDLYVNRRFADYSDPLGVRRDGWPVELKLIHPDRSEVNRAHGQVIHFGDVPFGPPLRDIMSWDDPPRIVQEDINLKTYAVHKTLEASFPRDQFGEYIKSFVDELDRPLARRELAAAGEVLKIQFAREQTVGTYSRDDFEAALLSRDGDKARDAARGAYEKREALNHPELVLAFSIYLAAHRAYLSQLYDAVERHPDLKEDAQLYGNTHAAFNNAFQFIPEATVYEAIMTTMLHERITLASQTPSPIQSQEGLSTEELLTLEAIGSGWKRFFHAGMLTSKNMFYKSKDGTKHPLTVVCPAKPHFRWAQKDGIIEHIYRKVIAMKGENLPLFEELIANTKRATFDALSGTEPYLELVGRTVNGFLSPAEIAASLGMSIASTPAHPQPSLPPKEDSSGRYPFPVYDRPESKTPSDSEVAAGKCPFAAEIGSVAAVAQVLS